MDNDLMERFEVESKIHAKRFEIMQDYLFLYGARLKGQRNLYERYNDEEILASSKEGKACMEALMRVQKKEEEIGQLLNHFYQIMGRELQRQN